MADGVYKSPSPFPSTMTKTEQPPVPQGYGSDPSRIISIKRGSQRALSRLNKLGFDPIEKMIREYKRIERAICAEERLRDNGPIVGNDGKIIRKFSTMYFASLLTIQQKLINDLMPYGYSKQPDNNDNDRAPAPYVINLTPRPPTNDAPYNPIRVPDQVPEDLKTITIDQDPEDN